MFQLKLALAWGQPIEYIENLDHDVMVQFKALNLISPFTHDVASLERGYICSLLHNQNVRDRSQMKSAIEMFPYGKGDTDFLEPELYIKAKKLLRSLDKNSPLYQTQLSEMHDNIRDTIEIESVKPDVDPYLIQKLQELLEK